MKNISVLAAILLTTMFFLSGFQKIITFAKTVDNFRGKININLDDNIYNVVILLVILLEILAPIIIVYHYVTGEYKTYSNYAIYSLIIFTILATLLYHPLHFDNYYKSIPFWANISLIGGLLMLIKE
jgi:uncharacterized membrane protein YphA (DoxX/SURF4 family)